VPELLNWLWQGCLLALATGVILRLGERVRSRDRHAICWAALIIVRLLPILQSISSASATSAIIATPPGEVALPMPSVWWTSGAMWALLWGIWCAVHLIRSAGAVRGIRRTRAACRPFPEAVAATLSNWQMVAPRGRQARLALSSDVRSASVLGCGSPVIAVSPALVRHLDAKELDGVVVHEWAHVQRRDDLQSVAQLAVRAIAGWHPAVCWLDRQLQIEREAASDEIAVSVTRCPKAYAATLTATASLLPRRPTEAATLGALSWSSLGTRVHRILSQRRLASRGWSATAAASAVVALCVGSLAVTGSRIAGIAVAPSPEATSGIAADRPAAPLALSARARQTAAAVDAPPSATTPG
jgi:serine-type D-Ala-D-Ala endopeptidase (penicillin-binding protein 7)